jgi:erythromycin esterase-like protein
MNRDNSEFLKNVINDKKSVTELMDLIEDIRSLKEVEVLLVGENTHSSSSLFQTKFDIAARCISELNFCAVLLESDVRPCIAISSLVTDSSNQPNSPTLDTIHTTEVLEKECKRFPKWLWRNKETVDFIVRLISINRKRQGELGNETRTPLLATRITSLMGISIYGLDIYSMIKSVDAVIEYFSSTQDCDSLELVRKSYSILEVVRTKGDIYAYKDLSNSETIASEKGVLVVALLLESRLQVLVTENAARALQRVATLDEILKKVSHLNEEERLFEAVLNSQAVKSSERYFARKGSGSISSWNVCERHFMNTITRVREHLISRQNLVESIARDYHHQDGSSSPVQDIESIAKIPRIVVLAHNTHIGDARATSSGQVRGDLSLGQLVRERIGTDKTFLLGMTTSSGNIIASLSWESPSFIRQLSTPLESSFDRIFSEAKIHRWYINFRSLTRQLSAVSSSSATLDFFRKKRTLRAIGVVYRPDHEAESHYIDTSLLDQFDGLLYIDSSNHITSLRSTNTTTREVDVEWS